ncbi:MAG: TonB-dependent receptor [Magnetococcales bacterium]|nr:TonB-dependent receptor [Magnetococcales bacterium]
MIFSDAGLRHSLRLLAVPLFLVTAPAYAQEMADEQAFDELEALMEYSIEDLVNIQVTTASRKEQRLGDTAAAVYVITQEEIRRSGATSIPEALRMAPGLHVARFNSNNWAITARGFNDQYSAKLLVLMDGRSIYTPLFSGVFWDMQDTMLEDVERIEVVRGPGGAMWGANAVNGVINIITKKTKDSQGWLVSLGGGDFEPYHTAFRYGGQLGEDATFRIWGKGFERNAFNAVAGGDAGDSWDGKRGGFRTEWQVNERNHLTLQGDLFQGDVDLESGEYEGGHVLLRWTHARNDQEASLQLYYDRAERIEYEKRDIFDLDFQHQFSPFDRHQIIWGLGYRLSDDETGEAVLSGGTSGFGVSTTLVTWDPAEKSDEIFSVFLQDEVTLIDETLKLIVGSKFEDNDYSGFEIQPNARLLWNVNESNTLWAAVSRAIRSPSRTTSDFSLIVSETGFTNTLVGTDNLDAESMMAYELGYRGRFGDRFMLDIAAFYNAYDDLISYENETTFIPPFSILVSSWTGSMLEAETYGVETAIHWQVLDNWKLKGSHTFLNMDLELKSGSTDTAGLDRGKRIPSHQFQIRSYLDLPYNLEFDTALYYVSHLKGDADIPAYARLDARLGWHPTKNWEVSLSAENIMDNEHPEFIGVSFPESEIPRSFFAKLTFKY